MQGSLNDLSLTECVPSVLWGPAMCVVLWSVFLTTRGVFLEASLSLPGPVPVSRASLLITSFEYWWGVEWGYVAETDPGLQLRAHVLLGFQNWIHRWVREQPVPALYLLWAASLGSGQGLWDKGCIQNSPPHDWVTVRTLQMGFVQKVRILHMTWTIPPLGGPCFPPEDMFQASQSWGSSSLGLSFCGQLWSPEEL